MTKNLVRTPYNSYVRLNKSYVRDNKSYVRDNKSYIRLDKSYVRDNFFSHVAALRFRSLTWWFHGESWKYYISQFLLFYRTNLIPAVWPLHILWIIARWTCLPPVNRIWPTAKPVWLCVLCVRGAGGGWTWSCEGRGDVSEGKGRGVVRSPHHSGLRLQA